MSKLVTVVEAVQRPGPVIMSKDTIGKAALSTDVFVSDSDYDSFAGSLHFPVASSGQFLCAQDLPRVQKPFRMGKIVAFFIDKSNFPIFVGQDEMSVSRVGI